MSTVITVKERVFKFEKPLSLANGIQIEEDLGKSVNQYFIDSAKGENDAKNTRDFIYALLRVADPTVTLEWVGENVDLCAPVDENNPGVVSQLLNFMIPNSTQAKQSTQNIQIFLVRGMVGANNKQDS